MKTFPLNLAGFVVAIYSRIKYRRERFKNEILDAIIKLNQRDRNLLFIVFDLENNDSGIKALSNMSRRQLADLCAQNYVRVTGRDWPVYHTFNQVVSATRRWG